MSIKLVDLVRLAGVELDDYKIHCATGANPTPLEVCDTGASDQHILSRETHWKRVLLSREFGHNRN